MDSMLCPVYATFSVFPRRFLCSPHRSPFGYATSYAALAQGFLKVLKWSFAHRSSVAPGPRSQSRSCRILQAGPRHHVTSWRVGSSSIFYDLVVYLGGRSTLPADAHRAGMPVNRGQRAIRNRRNVEEWVRSRSDDADCRSEPRGRMSASAEFWGSGD